MDIGIILTILGYCKDLFVEYMKGENFKSIFTKTGASLRQINAMEADWQSDAAQKIDILFSEDQMKEMAQKCENLAGDDLWVCIEQRLRSFYSDYELQDIDIDKQVAMFKKEFMRRLKAVFPGLYNQFFLNEFREETKQDHQQLYKENQTLQYGQGQLLQGQMALLQGQQVLNKRLQDTQQAQSEMLDRLVTIETFLLSRENITNLVLQCGIPLCGMEERLRIDTATNATFYKGLDLDFYDFGYQKVDQQIIDAMNDNETAIWIKSQVKEEGLYYVLRVIKQFLPDLMEKVLVVEQEKHWATVKRYAKGWVLIPVFDAKITDPIPGNKIILIETDKYINFDENTIIIPKRSGNNLFEKLRNYTKDFDKTHIYLERTSGNYAPLMRTLSVVRRAPAWASGNIAVLLVAALVGTWTDKEGDQNIVESLAGKPYDDYVNDLLKCAQTAEDPFLIQCNTIFGKEYRVCDPYEAVNYLKCDFTKDLLCSFASCAKKVFLSVHSVINPLGFTEETGIYSTSIKSGIAKTLIVLSLTNYTYDFVKGRNYEYFAKTVIRELLDCVTTKENWDAMVELLPLLVEAAPEEVLSKIEKCIEENDDVFWSLFAPGTGFYFSNSQYVYVLEALTVALFIKEVSVRSLQLLESIADKEIEYKLANSPIRTLSNYFCSWYYEVDITKDEKIEQLRHFALTHPESCWKVLRNVLPQKLPGVADVFRKPLYRPYNEAKTKCITDIRTKFAIEKEYLRIAFQCAGSDLIKWADLLENGQFIQYGLKETLVETIQHLLQTESYGDDIKYELEKAIRRFLYSNRFFGNNTLAAEEDLQHIEENLLVKITYANPVYHILYAFDEAMLIIDPVTMEEDKQGHYQININKKNKEQIDILKRDVLSGDIKLEELLEKTEDNYQLGNKIFDICHNKAFSASFAHNLYILNKQATLNGYLNSALSHLDIQSFFALLAQVSAQYPETEFQFRLLETRRIDDPFFECLISLDTVLQDYYWARTVNTWFDVPNFTLHRDTYVTKLTEHGNFRQFTLLLEDLPLKLETYFNILIIILNNNKAESVADYDILKIFERIYAFKITDVNVRNIVVQLEMNFIGAFEQGRYYGNKKPKYLLERLKAEPDFCADLLLYYYQKKEMDPAGRTLDEEAKWQWKRWAFRILYFIKFCPYEAEGRIDENKLKQWCEAFTTIMNKAGLADKGRYALGRFLANCPKPVDDSSWPLQPVCKVIEIYYSTDLEQGFCDMVVTNRGCYTDSQGREEEAIAQRYENCLHALELYYPKTAKVLRKLVAGYREEARQAHNSK